MKTSNAKILQKELSKAKTEISKLKRKLKKCEPGAVDEQHTSMEVLPRGYKTRYTGTPEEKHIYQIVRQRELEKKTATDYHPEKLVPNKPKEEPKPKG